MRRVYLVCIYLQWKLFYFFINHFNSLIIMRKLFTTLKSVVAAALVVSMVGVTSCSYDDTDLKNQVENLGEEVEQVKEDLATLTQRVADLEKKVADEVDALKGLIKNQVVVTSVVEENGGVTVTLSDGNEFTVYPKTVDTDTDTDTYISVKADETTGVYYWAIFNKDGFVEYLTVGVSEERVPVFQEQEDTCEPIDLKFQVNEATGTIEFSVDGGQTWTDSGVEVGACDCEGTVVSTGACIFKNVVVRDHYVTFTLADGSEVVVFLAELIEFEAGRDHFYVKPGEVKALPFVVNEQVEDISVMNQPMGWKASVELDEDQSAVVEPAQNAYILNIEGPSQEFVNAGYAEKTGAIQLHITTATGACKVVKVGVDLAEITLTVDAEGNVTITSTMASLQQQYGPMGWETVMGYDSMQIGMIHLSDYQSVDGDLSLLFDEWLYPLDWNMPNATAYFDSLYTNIMQSEPVYIEGEVEKLVFNTTIEQLLKEMYGYPRLDPEESFAIFVIPTDAETGTPIFDQAIVAEFKQIFATATEVVEKRELDNAYFDFKLKGAEGYYVAVINKALVEEYFSYGGYAAHEDVVAEMLYFNYIPDYGWDVISWNSYYAPVAYVEGNHVGEYSIADIFGYNLLESGTEYYMTVVAKDGENYPTVEDLVLVEFATANPPSLDFTKAVATFQPSDPNWVVLTFTDADSNVLEFPIGNGGAKHWNAGLWSNYNSYDSGFAIGNAYFNGEYLWNCDVVVSVDGDVYTAEFTKIINGSVNYIATYEGEIEGFGAPFVFNAVRCEYDDKFETCGNNDSEYIVKVYDADGNYLMYVNHCDISTDFDDIHSGKLVKANGTEIEVSKFNAIQAPSDWNCEAGQKYISVSAVLTDGTVISVSTQLPATTFNYL